MKTAHSLTGDRTEPVVLGRYMLCDVIGGGGMAKVHIGRVIGAAGFSRVVAIKRLHPECALDPQVSAMLIDEARLVSRIRHPNVVPTLDVVAIGEELLLVMEYVHGISIAQLNRLARAKNERVPLAIASRLIIDVLAGLSAAHEAKSERGRLLDLVHRDVSPQNVLVDVSGLARIVDFGIAKAEGKLVMTRQGQIRGKLDYMSPEQIRGDDVDRRTDLYAVGVVLWELVCGRRLFERQPKDLAKLVQEPRTRIDRPSKHRGEDAAPLDRVLERALATNRDDRFSDADEMAAAVGAACPPASTKEVGAYVDAIAGSHLERRDLFIERAEQLSEIHDLPTEAPPAPPSSSSSSPLLSPLSPPPRPRRHRGFFIVGLATTIAFGVAALARSPVRAVAPPAASFTLPEPAVEPAAVESDAGADPAATELPIPSATTPHGARPKPRGPHPAATPNCSLPYTIDARGIRIPRRECLGR